MVKEVVGERGAREMRHTLALAKNQIAVLPESFATLPKLRYLNLRSNRLTEFPEVVSNYAGGFWM